MIDSPETSDDGVGLEVHDVSHCYGTLEAVKHASLRIVPGQVHGLLGESGSGKSTLLRMVAGLETTDRGRIHIDGRCVSGDGIHVPAEKRSIGLVFQDFALFPTMNVLKNVMFGMTERTRSERRARAIELLNSVQLADSANAYPHTLSGGQQQRVALVRALARRPAVMLLDEPFSGLDPRLRDQVRGMTMDVLRRSNMATLWVTHDPHEALVASDQVSLIREGVVIQTGTPVQIYAHPVDVPAAEFFGSVNVLTGTDGAVSILRPEDVRMHELRDLDAAPIAGERCRGIVEEVEFEGATALCTVASVSGKRWFIREPASTHRSTGLRVAVVEGSREQRLT